MRFIDYTYLTSILFAFLSGVFSCRLIDKAAKIFIAYLLYTFLSECVAYYCAVKYRDNFPVYTIYSIVEFGFMAMYFNYSIDLFKKLHIGVYIAGLGLVLGVCNILFLEGLDSSNCYFFFFEGFCIIGMCLFAFFRLLLQREHINLFKYIHFWIIAIVLFFRTISYIYDGLYDVLLAKLGNDLIMITKGYVIVNITCYALIGVVFLLCKRMQKQ